MAHSELLTCVQEGLRVHFCLFDNSGWGCIENLQNNQGNDTFGTVFRFRNPQSGELDGPVMPIDFAKNASAYGLKAYTSTRWTSCARRSGRAANSPCPFCTISKSFPDR